MDEQPDIDDAIPVAIDRTRTAQEKVDSFIDERRAPPGEVVEVVEHRAEDLAELTREDADADT
jgi:hypothetical protein